MTLISGSGHSTISIAPLTIAELPNLEPLWLECYAHQSEHGMMLTIPENGFQLWVQSLSSTLGRFATVFRATVDDEIVGFLACRIRNLPPYFGGFQVGFVSEVHVREANRRHGVGRKLSDAALVWFREQGIDRVELQVVVSNVGAIEAYRRLGWQGELYQMVWQRPGT